MIEAICNFLFFSFLFFDRCLNDFLTILVFGCLLVLLIFMVGESLKFFLC